MTVRLAHAAAVPSSNPPQSPSPKRRKHLVLKSPLLRSCAMLAAPSTMSMYVTIILSIIAIDRLLVAIGSFITNEWMRGSNITGCETVTTDVAMLSIFRMSAFLGGWQDRGDQNSWLHGGVRVDNKSRNSLGV